MKGGWAPAHTQGTPRPTGSARCRPSPLQGKQGWFEEPGGAGHESGISGGRSAGHGGVQGRSFRRDLRRGTGDVWREFIVLRAFQVALVMVFGSRKLLRSFKPESDLLVPTFREWTPLCERRVIWDHVRPWEGDRLGDHGAELGQDTVPAGLRTRVTGTHSREAQISRGQLQARPSSPPTRGDPGDSPAGPRVHRTRPSPWAAGPRASRCVQEADPRQAVLWVPDCLSPRVRRGEVSQWTLTDTLGSRELRLLSLAQEGHHCRTGEGGA